jgi:CRISPR-associated protein Csb1
MTTHRTVLTVDLKPLVGSRFQPTGFPDLGAAEFEHGDGTRALLVESTQSMANRLEETTWDSATSDQIPELAPLPYLKIVDQNGSFLSASRLEAHRLASAYVMNSQIAGVKGEDFIRERLGLVAGRPLDNRAVARACFALDPLSLLHGVFFARKGWPWQPRITRAVTSFIEAQGVRPAVSGGVKRDVVINEAKEGATAEGYGNVPHHRVEYTAEQITAFFAIDHDLLRSYGLPGPATALLEALAEFEIGTLLDRGLRLRTACDLTVRQEPRNRPNTDDAAQRITKFAAECSKELGTIVTATWSGRGK